MSWGVKRRPCERETEVVTDWNWNRLMSVAFVLMVSLSLVSKTSEVVAGVGIAQDDETLEWLSDYDEAMALAKETGKPVFLEFRCAP